jgi:PKD repeat protein
MSGRFGSIVMDGRTRAMSTVIALLLLSSTLVGCSGLSSTTPNAKISSDQQQINVGETVNFDARESSTPEPTFIDEYRWNFGDGQTRETKQGIVSHTFESAGDHEVEVTVINDNGEIDRASLTIFVNSPPSIELVMPTYVRAGETARLDASDSTDPEGAAVEFMWDFDLGIDSDGDGEKTNDADATSPYVDLIIDNSGNRTGSVSVIDDKGAMNTQTWSLMVISRTFKVVWEEQHLEVEWSGYLEQGQFIELEHDPGEGARIIQVNATLTLARDLLPIQWPEDNFTLSLNVPASGWNIFASTTHDNITENASASIDRSDMNSIPESGYTITADSSEGLVEALLNEPGERFGQGTWYWMITADECDPDLPVDDVDPDQGNDWELMVEIVILVPRVSEIGV